MLKKDNSNWNIGSLFLDSYRVFRYSGKFWIDDFFPRTWARDLSNPEKSMVFAEETKGRKVSERKLSKIEPWMVTHCFLNIDLLSLMNQCEVQQAYSCYSKSRSSQVQTLRTTLHLLYSNLLTWRHKESVVSNTVQKNVTWLGWSRYYILGPMTS